MNYGIDVNCNLAFISQHYLFQLNDIIACLQGQTSTLANDIKNFQKLRDTLQDIRYAKASHPSKIRKELKNIEGYVVINIIQMRNQHKKRLAYFKSEWREEREVDTSEKMKRDIYISRTEQFIQQMELLLE